MKICFKVDVKFYIARLYKRRLITFQQNFCTKAIVFVPHLYLELVDHKATSSKRAEKISFSAGLNQLQL